MNADDIIKVVKELGFPIALSIGLLIVLVKVVKFFIEERKDARAEHIAERQKFYEQQKEISKQTAESNKGLSDSLNELAIIIKTKNQ